jgi:hypothetical protein
LASASTYAINVSVDVLPKPIFWGTAFGGIK